MIRTVDWIVGTTFGLVVGARARARAELA